MVITTSAGAGLRCPQSSARACFFSPTFRSAVVVVGLIMEYPMIAAAINTQTARMRLVQVRVILRSLGESGTWIRGRTTISPIRSSGCDDADVMLSSCRGGLQSGKRWLRIV